MFILLRISLVCFLLSFCLQVVAAGGPRVACWVDHDVRLIAASSGEKLRLASFHDTTFTDIVTLPVAADSQLAVGAYAGAAVLLIAQGKELFRLDYPTKTLVKLGDFPAPILQLLPARAGKAGAVLLTGDAGVPVPVNGVLYWATWEQGYSSAVVADIPAEYRPWKLWWSAVPGEERLAVATYKKTAFAPFEHNCMFLYAWKNGVVQKRWLGSRLTRPYLDATHADIRAAGDWRMVALEVTADGGTGISVYQSAQFGYLRNWNTETIAGLEEISAFDDMIILFGHDNTGKALAWRLLNNDGEEYRLETLTETPPTLADVTRLDEHQLGGWWTGGWQSISLPAAAEKKKGD